jgi:hypothetical protein
MLQASPENASVVTLDLMFYIPVGNVGPKIGYSWLYLSGKKYDI